MNPGTLVANPEDHVMARADHGPLLRDTARVVETLRQPEQTYVSSWSHAVYGRKAYLE
jgi:ATP adenylyltransferase